MHLADQLIRVSKMLAKQERALRRDTRGWSEQALGASDDAPTLPPEHCAANVEWLARATREHQALQVRVWRVIEGLALAARGGGAR